MKVVLLAFYVLITTNITAQTEKKPGGPQFTFTGARARDLGNILLNANTATRFEFKNTGDQPLIIKSMGGSGKGLNSPNYKIMLSYTQSPIRPGDMGVIEVTFIAQGDTGNFRNRIWVTSNATGANYPLLYVTGSIVSEFEQPKTRPALETPKEFRDTVISTRSK